MYSTERALAEHGSKLAEGERAAVEQALSEARDALKAEDAERMRRAQDGLTRAAQTLAQAAQRGEAGRSSPGGGTPGPTGGTGGSPGGGGDADVVDAEYTVKN